MKIFAFVFALYATAVIITAQSPTVAPEPEPASPMPSLTDLQKSQIQSAAQLVEVHRLRVRVATLEYESVMSNFRGMIDSVQIPGYTLEPNTLTYTKIADTPNP